MPARDQSKLKQKCLALRPSTNMSLSLRLDKEARSQDRAGLTPLLSLLRLKIAPSMMLIDPFPPICRLLHWSFLSLIKYYNNIYNAGLKYKCAGLRVANLLSFDSSSAAPELIATDLVYTKCYTAWLVWSLSKHYYSLFRVMLLKWLPMPWWSPGDDDLHITNTTFSAAAQPVQRSQFQALCIITCMSSNCKNKSAATQPA